jgi:hypothetical protein
MIIFLLNWLERSEKKELAAAREKNKELFNQAVTKWIERQHLVMENVRNGIYNVEYPPIEVPRGYTWNDVMVAGCNDPRY